MKLEDRDFIRLRDFMMKNYGINLANKSSLIEGRLSSVVMQAGYDNFKDYVDFVFQDKSGSQVSTLVSKLTTNFTYFMRERVHFDFMMERALPEWASRIRDYDLRVWSAGCSSGEEAYTAAMVIDQFFGTNKPRWDTTILATDISDNVLKQASLGIYSPEHLEELDERWVRKYFTKQPDGKYKMTDSLAKEVVFANFNLMGDFSRFRKKFHIIFCRNVMIYFNNETRGKLIRKFHDVLHSGGYLFIGRSETMSSIPNEFEYVMPSIYRKGDHAR